jgi:glycosyltransferase involved in cell wall biosynthesis
MEAVTPSDEGDVVSATPPTGASPVRVRTALKRAPGPDADPDQLDSALVLTAHFAAERSRRRERQRTPASRPARPTVSIVIPTLNEAENLPYILPQLPMHADELVLVDGRSTDETLETARRLCPDIQIVIQEGMGKGAALQSGFSACTGDIIVMLDADGSNDPAEIPRFVGALLSGADFAKGSRFLQGGGTADMPRYRKAGNRLFVWLVRLLFGSRYSDLCYGYNAFWRDVIEDLTLDANGFEIETMMNIRALRAGLTIVEVPSFEEARIHGESKLQTITDGWRVLRTIFSERLAATSSSTAARTSIEGESLAEG